MNILLRLLALLFDRDKADYLQMTTERRWMAIQEERSK